MKWCLLRNSIFFQRQQWGNSLEFILTVIGYAVGNWLLFFLILILYYYNNFIFFKGLGNVWRFPFLVFDNGGGAFLIIFFAMLFLVGIPMFFLELAIGQFSGLGPTHVFYSMAPAFQGAVNHYSTSSYYFILII